MRVSGQSLLCLRVKVRVKVRVRVRVRVVVHAGEWAVPNQLVMQNPVATGDGA